MASRAASVILAFVAPALFSGCGTLLGNGGCAPPRWMEPYGGVKTCLEAGVQLGKEVISPVIMGRTHALCFGLFWLGVDLPLSAVADTVLLPVTSYFVLTGEAKFCPIRWKGRWHEGAPPASSGLQPHEGEFQPPPSEATRPPD